MRQAINNKPRNIYNHIISETKFRAGFWADQKMVWRFWKKDYSSSFTMSMNILRTNVKKIEKMADGPLSGYMWEPSGTEVMKLIDREAIG